MNEVQVLRAFLRRDWAIDISYRAAFAFEFVGMVIIVATFFYLSRVVDNGEFSADQSLSGGYFGFIAIGLAFVQIVQVSFTSFARKLRDEQTTGTLEALIATPTNTSVIILSSAAYDLLRATLEGVILLSLSVAVFGLDLDTTPPSLLIALGALVGCIGFFASLGVAVAAFTVVYKRGVGMLTFVVSGLALLGGVYFPVTVLPGGLEAIANLLPFTWGLDVARAALLGGDVDSLQLGGLFAAVAALLPLALVTFNAAIRQAARAGTLGQY
jgi:ABC-2 type transport system permease protein